jgi:rhodanese-related sulfurtransferase
MLPNISPEKALEMVKAGEARLVDVRESSEYAEMHVPGARLVPLSIAQNYPLQDDDAPEKPVIFFCRSGKRTEKNAALLSSLAGDMPSYQVEGGLSAWKQAGLPVEQSSTAFPMFRQIQIGAGLLVLLGIFGSFVWHPMYLLSAFVGAGLVFAGVTGFCGLALLLARMPWNKAAAPSCGSRCGLPKN